MAEARRGKSPGSRRTQFPKGVSGNKRGRPRGAKGIRSVLREELSEFVTISENGKSRRVSKLAVIMKSLVAMAATGNVRATDKLIGLLIKLEGFEDQRPSAVQQLSSTDETILKHLLGQVGEGSGPGDPEATGETNDNGEVPSEPPHKGAENDREGGEE